jgi:hypothetical protein
MATTRLPAGPTNLPLALTPLVGRGRELAAIEEILGRNRLATRHEAYGANGDPRRSLAVPTGADEAEVGQRGPSYSEANR